MQSVFQFFQPYLTILEFLLFFLIVYFLVRIPPIVRMYAEVFILVGKLLYHLEQWLQPFEKAQKTNGSRYPGLRTIILTISMFLALAALTAEAWNTLQSLSALFPDANITLPSLGFLNWSMGLLYLAVPSL